MRTGLIATLLIAIAVIASAVWWNVPFAGATADEATSGSEESILGALPSSGGVREYLSPALRTAAQQSGLLPAGAKSLLKTDGKMRHGEYKWDDDGVPEGQLIIWVDLRTQLISVFRGGHEIGTAVIVYGAETMQSPLGRFPILSKHRDYHSRSYDAPMPYSLFITNTGIALHGSPMSSRRATHGCVGLPEEFARRLFGAAKTGDEVHIVRSKAKAQPATSQHASS